MFHHRNRTRSHSFADIDEAKASGLLTDIIRENNVFLGGSSIGKGLKTAARYQMQQLLQHNPSIVEDGFYVVDLGILVSQVYQWRKYFPRVEPFYAVKCNPDPVIVKTLATLGCHFDCASRAEIKLVQDVSANLPLQPDIIYANPCKARGHLSYALACGVHMMTFDNVAEVVKCASMSKDIKLLMRVVTDDRGSQCRLSSKFGAPRSRWRNLLRAAKENGLEVVGCSFHVGSGCRDASRYAAALKDCREIFDMAKEDYGFDFSILDIGGGFPGETHSLWNPAELDKDDDEESDEGIDSAVKDKAEEVVEESDHFMFFTEIAEAVAPIIDELFPIEDGVRVIGEPGRYFVAAAATLVASVLGTRSNEVDEEVKLDPISDMEASQVVGNWSREEQDQAIAEMDAGTTVMESIAEGINDYAKLIAHQNLAQQETDVYNDAMDLYTQDFDTAADLLGMPDEDQKKDQIHSVEGMPSSLLDGDGEPLISLAAAGEAAVNGMVMQAVADSNPLQDDFAYYINDGVYGAFNNLMFDHATIRPRVLRNVLEQVKAEMGEVADGSMVTLFERADSPPLEQDRLLYASTLFGPTCDSIDVIARSVLLPKLKIGDWLYFQNMGAYTMAAASSFNGFEPTVKMYVCSVQPEYFEDIIAGPDAATAHQILCEEKKDDR
jgi:ornithine decarboxylase